ncbi:MAG: ribbon-helix-helix protein, CopG family [Actinobacteria bacterium]|nr:ribbon-helix-helix protein, CopG family [Actinomycetota bacterium]
MLPRYKFICQSHERCRSDGGRASPRVKASHPRFPLRAVTPPRERETVQFLCQMQGICGRSIPVYPASMAKVMISLPDSLLERIDAHVRANRTSRSRFLRELAQRELDLEDADRGERVRRLLEDPESVRADSVYLVKQARWSR